jgi:hypothetical protein
MNPNSRSVRAYRGFKWTEKLSFECLGEGDVFVLYEADGKQVTGEKNGKKVTVFKATSSPRKISGIWGIDAEPYTENVPEIK